MHFVIPQHVVSVNGGFVAMLFVVAIVALVSGNRQKTKADAAERISQRLQSGLEAVLARLNPNLIPSKRETELAEAKPEASPESASDKVGPPVEVVGTAAAPVKKKRAPRQKKPAAPPIDPVQAEWEAQTATRMAYANRDFLVASSQDPVP